MTYEISTVDLPEQHTAVVRGHVAATGIAEFLGHVFPAVVEAVTAQGREVVGPPFSRYGDMDDAGWDVEAGFPVDGPVEDQGEVTASHLPAVHAARLVHTGSYDTVAAGWEALGAWVTDNGYAPTKAPWECYLDGPEVAAPRTLVVMPCRLPQHAS